MPKKPSKKLFELISSLSQNEKRYFRKFASQHTRGIRNNYVRLFDVVDKQHEYDEAKVISELGKQNTSTLARTKVHLYTQIVRSLENFHSASGVQIMIRRQLNQVDILFRKMMYDHCLALVIKGKKLAYQYEKYELLLALLDRETSLSGKLFTGSVADRKLVNILKEERDVTQKLVNLVNCRQVSVAVNLLSNRHFVGTDNKWSYPSLKESDLECLEIPERKVQQSDIATVFAYRYFAMTYFMHSDLEQAYYWQKDAVQIMESRKDLIQEHPEYYITCLNNLGYTLHQLNDRKRFKEVADKLNQLPNDYGLNKNLHVQVLIVERACLYELIQCIDCGKYREGLQLLKRIIPEISKYENYLDPVKKTILYYNVAMLYFANGHYSKCISWINRVFYTNIAAIKPEVRMAAQVLLIMAHFEKKNWDALEYILKVENEGQANDAILPKFKRMVINFIRSEMKSFGKHNATARFKAFKTKLEGEINVDQLAYFGLEIFMPWLQSKSVGKSLAEVVQQEIEAGKQ